MTMIKKTLKDAQTRQIDLSFQIADLFSDPKAPFDAVIGTLDGKHGFFTNAKSEKAYLILEGSGVVTVDGVEEPVSSMDFVYIPKGKRHGLNGKLKFLILCSPPFDPAYETSSDD